MAGLFRHRSKASRDAKLLGFAQRNVLVIAAMNEA
jgi:hypothetical protein